MGAGDSIVKYILFAVNLCFVLAGLVLLGLGIAIKLKVSVMEDMPQQVSQQAPYSLIAIGAIIFGIAFFGCCGAITENRFMLITYTTIMIVLMIISAYLAIFVFVKLDDIIEKVPEYMDEAKHHKSFHDIESKFECCGTNGPWFYGRDIPDSCCTDTPCTKFDAYTQGCNSVIADFIRKYGQAIGGIFIGIAAIELVGAVFGFCLAIHAGNKSGRFY